MIELTEEQKAEEKAELIELYGKDLANDVVTDEQKEKAKLEEEELRENAIFDLDKALDSYDETFSKYMEKGISDDAVEFFVQMKLVQGSDFEFDTPVAHYFMVDMLLGHITDTNLFPYSKEVCDRLELDVLFIGFMASRGLAKSTLIISFFAVYSAIKGKLPNGLGKVYFYLLLAASSKGGARVNALAVRAMCEDSSYLKDYFESMRFTESESEFVRKSPLDKDIPKKDRSFLIRYQGINTGVRGSRYGERRPDCHTRGTIVTTEYGTYPIEEHPGIKSEGHMEICKSVSLRGLPTNEVVSRDHKYWSKICVGNKCIVDKGSKLPRYSTSYERFTKVSDLTKNHWIGSKIDQSICDISPIEFSVKINGANRSSDGRVRGTEWGTEEKIHQDMNKKEFSWIYGLWLGDGTIAKNNKGNNSSTVSLYVADTQRDTVGKKLCKYLKALDKNYSEHKYSPGCYIVVFHDTAIANWMRKYKRGNSLKDMPQWVLNIDKEYQKQILLGYIAADGHIDLSRNNQIRINSVNYMILSQLQIVASRLGLPTYIRNTKQAGETYFKNTGKIHKTQHQWELRLKNGCAKILGIKEIVDQTRIKHKQVHISNGILWRQVKLIENTTDVHELIPIQCDNKELANMCDTTHAYSTEFGISKNCIIMDDALLNTAAAYSKVISENLDEIIHSDATNALKGGGMGRVILCFTPFHYGDVNTKSLLQGAFTPVVIPMARKFNVDNKLLKESEIYSSWEGMHPSKSIISLIKRARRSKKLKLFMQERMLRLTSGADRLVPDNCIQFCDMKPIVKNLDAYTICITTDYTTTSGEKSDFSGRATWAVSNNEDWFLLDLALRKMSMEEQYEETINEAAKWKRRGKHVEIGVEIDGNQSAHIYSLEKIMMTRGDWYSFAKEKGDPYSKRKGILSKSTGVRKHERFRIASQILIQQKMWFPEHLRNTPDMIEFISQIKGATHENFTRADDGPDLITMALVSMNVIYPSEDAAERISELRNGTVVDDPFWGEVDNEYSEINGYSSYCN